ncbi:MAG: carbon starvation protein A [Lachnospiraceae bacterium]|nr:carbon starvation protein A [Lachnospiraceae bacterium]MCI8781517.1 carbon starvation protein A [Lachnospiraceae bacterium]
MNGFIIILAAAVFLVGAYLIYGRYLVRKWGIDPDAKTPAYTEQDGVDYVPADTNIVFGHQFASIAGAAPITGPIQAAVFGWLPALLWILLGGVFFGAVQDFAAMYASVKNKGKSIGYIIEKYIGKLGKRLFLIFVWLFSILVIAAFADVVATTFNGFGTEGEKITANAAVASTSVLFIVFAVGLGFFLKHTHFPAWANTVVAIVLLVLSIALGMNLPLYFSREFWLIFVFLYILVACVTPVWALLQPRDFLNSYLLIAMMLMAFVGIIVYHPAMNLVPFTSFKLVNETTGAVSYLFPTLFVTIACGAVSGFHSLVSSGTASKQIKNEKAMLPVSYGAMLLESFLAVIALVSVGFAASGSNLPEGTPAQVFATSISVFLTKVGLSQDFSYTLITLAVSAFALTSLDSVARIGRLSLQEFFMDDNKEMGAVEKVCSNKWFATVITLALSFLLAKAGYESIWPLFGSANQMLSALALVSCAVFLKKTKRQGIMLWGPMFIMLAVTFTAIVLKIKDLLVSLSGQFVSGDAVQLVFAVLLLGLGIMVAVEGLKKLLCKQS